MLVTLTRTAPRAPEVGYLLGKNPGSVFQREFSAGTVWVFYLRVTDARVTIALLAEIDPVALESEPVDPRLSDNLPGLPAPRCVSTR